MSIWLERITVENLGPIGNRTFELGRFNLIYGRNEAGKTYLVEFLLRSLFSHAADFPLRDGVGHGKVTVGGLAESTLDFMPDGGDKLEDYLTTGEAGLPANIARLLVVKGGELSLTDANRTGVDRDVLKRALSSEALIDRILANIQKTVQQAQVVDGRIEAAQRGEIKDRLELKENLDRLNRLADQVEARYSRGPLRVLKLRRQALKTEQNLQLQAKWHLAYQLHRKRNQWTSEREQLPQADLDALKVALRDHEKTSQDVEKSQERLAAAQEEAREYPWLQEANQIWERQNLTGAKGPNVGWIIAAGASVVISVALGLVGTVFNLIPTAAYVLAGLSTLLLVLGFGLGGFYVWKLRREASTALESHERRQIERGYQERFGRPLRGLTDLRTQLDKQKAAHNRVENLDEQLAEELAEQREIESKINRLMLKLIGEPVSQEAWKTVAESLYEKADDLDHKINELDLEIRELSVDEADHRLEPAEVDYSKARLDEIETELAQVKQDLQSAQQDLDNLKQEIARETGDEISATWEVILKNLRERQRQAKAEYRRATARILGQIVVSQVVEEVKSQETEKIRRGLQDEAVTQLLVRVTDRYRALDFLDGRVVVQGDTADYDLAELSTGAREQVLLALRMGFAKRLARNRPLFLLLDDAFQHSDWQRRRNLVEAVRRMVMSGWQVTYFTMDDHLRDLMTELGERSWPDDFARVELD